MTVAEYGVVYSRQFTSHRPRVASSFPPDFGEFALNRLGFQLNDPD